MNGAEQVQATTLKRFCEKFGPSGFTMDKFYPCYGLAEATLILTGGKQGAPPAFFSLGTSTEKPSDMLVACGTSLPEGEIRIVDPNSSRACPPLTVGEIWARGPGVSPGYFAQADWYGFLTRGGYGQTPCCHSLILNSSGRERCLERPLKVIRAGRSTCAQEIWVS